MPTAQQLIYDARALIDEYVEEGVVIAPEDVATIEANGLRFLNMGLQEAYTEAREYAEFEILNKKIPNLLGSQFNIEEFIGEDQHYPQTGEGSVGAKSYFFTLDSDAIVYIREYDGATWNIIDTLTLTPTEETDYKGAITPTDPSYPIELVFSGTTYYRHLNRCLYSYPFKSDAIPDYKAWRRYDMPSNYGQLDKIVAEFTYKEYVIDNVYKWEGFNTLAVDYDYDGKLKVIYKPIPEEITDLSETVEVNNTKALQFIVFFIAAKLATTENTDLVSFYEQKANEMRAEAFKGQPAGEQPINDVYFSSDSVNYYGGYRYGYIHR